MRSNRDGMQRGVAHGRVTVLAFALLVSTAAWAAHCLAPREATSLPEHAHHVLCATAVSQAEVPGVTRGSSDADRWAAPVCAAPDQTVMETRAAPATAVSGLEPPAFVTFHKLLI